MLLRQFVCGRRSKAVFSILFLLSATYSFSMEEESPSSEGAPWSDSIKVDQAEHLKHVMRKTMHDPDSKEESDTKEDEPLPEWLVESCLQNMPPLLKGIHNYMKSGAMDDPKRVTPAFHRFLLVGPPGASKSMTAEAMAQSLGYEKKIIPASSLLGRYRSHTAVNIRDLFERHRGGKTKMMLIINELHKLFEGHTNEHTDHAETAMSFWEQLDKLERSSHNIITAVTSNHVDKIPKELKSRFHGQWIYMPLLRADQAMDVFDRVVAQDASIKVGEAVREDALAFFSEEKKYSHRDVGLFIGTAKMFAHAEQIQTGVIALTSEHFRQARHNFDDPERIMKFDEEQMDEQEKRHAETLRLHDQHFAQQQLIQVVSGSHQKHQEGLNLGVFSSHTAAGLEPKGARRMLSCLNKRQRELLKENCGDVAEYKYFVEERGN